MAKETPCPIQDVVGIVDVAALGDSSVLRELEEVEEYLYVSGMAVATGARYNFFPHMNTRYLRMVALLGMVYVHECQVERVSDFV